MLLMDEARLVIAACLHCMPKTQVKKGKNQHIQKAKCDFSGWRRKSVRKKSINKVLEKLNLVAQHGNLKGVTTKTEKKHTWSEAFRPI